MIHFCFDHLGINQRLGYPNLARHGLTPDQFDTTWPRSIPLRLLMYFDRAGIAFQCHITTLAPEKSWYPIALGWNDHDLDYFGLIPCVTMEHIRSGRIRILFYYHEGDNPTVIKRLLDHRIAQYRLPSDCYLFVSANTAADHIANFKYFDDHEYFFRYVNRRQHSDTADHRTRAHRFTALNRTHKWWRASIMSDLYHSGVLDHSLWSYNTDCTVDDEETNNPLELDVRPTWRQQLGQFLDRGPYFCDQLDSTQHNDHRLVQQNLYHQSYCQVVLETHYDADGSGGAFITEKTYKCIKYGQPFLIVGTSGSLALLRHHGYRVFDHALDNRYDDIAHNTRRWLSLRRVLQDLSQQDLHRWYLRCLDDVRHNQWLFAQRQHGHDLSALAHMLSA